MKWENSFSPQTGLFLYQDSKCFPQFVFYKWIDQCLQRFVLNESIIETLIVYFPFDTDMVFGFLSFLFLSPLTLFRSFFVFSRFFVFFLFSFSALFLDFGTSSHEKNEKSLELNHWRKEWKISSWITDEKNEKSIELNHCSESASNPWQKKWINKNIRKCRKKSAT